MLLTQFESLKGLNESKPPKRRKVFSLKRKQKMNITQRQKGQSTQVLSQATRGGEYANQRTATMDTPTKG